MLELLDVERRLVRACRTLRVLPDHEQKFFRMMSPWPEVVREISDAYGYTAATAPKFHPTPRDVSDMLTALAWVRPLSKKEFQIIWWRSFGLSFRTIGDRIRRSDETARSRYRDALYQVWLEAVTPGGVRQPHHKKIHLGRTSGI